MERQGRGVDWLVRRPVALLSGVFVAGALAEAGLPEGKEIALVASLFALLAFIVAFTFATHRLFWLALASFAMGCGLMRWRLPPAPPDLKAPFDGIVAAVPMPMPYGYRLLLRVDKPVNGFAQLAVRDEPLSASPRWQIGDRILVRRFWGRPSSWRRHRFQCIFWVGRTTADDLQRIGYEASAFPLTRWRERWRRWVFQRWAQSLPPREHALELPFLASLVFGMRTVTISEADAEAFARSGLAHLFVPSGTQVTLLMGLVWLAHRYLHLPPVARLADFSLPGEHNRSNLRIAIGAALLAGALPERIADALREFRGVPHRLEFVAEVDGIRFYDDSAATTPAATVAALRAFDCPVILIAGGRDKGGDWSEFARLAKTHLKALIAIGEFADPLMAMAQQAGVPVIVKASDMNEAVERALSLAHKGDIVLLSPGCASFDLFANYEERGKTFKAAVQRLSALK